MRPGADNGILPAEESTFVIEFHHLVADDNKQDSAHSICTESMRLFKQRNPHIKTAYLQSTALQIIAAHTP